MSDEKYKPHRHKLANANDLHRNEHETAGINQRIAVAITRASGTMFCAYLFALLALLGLPALSAWLGPLVAVYVVWASQTLIQLCMLPILSVGQGVIGRKQEIQAEETFEATEKSFHDVELILKQNNEQIQILEEQGKLQSAQYQELLKQTAMLVQLLAPPQKRKTTKLEVKS